jgi:cytochrome b561
VVAGHVGAALKHHFIDRDDILTRMAPRHSRKEQGA